MLDCIMDKRSHKASSTIVDNNLSHSNVRGSKPTLPRSNRQYIPPLMLAKGRGKRLNELHSSHDHVQTTSNIGFGSNLGVKPPIGTNSRDFKSNGGYASHSKDSLKKGDSSGLRNNNRASFNPLHTPILNETILVDNMSSSAPFHEDIDGDHDFHSSPEDEDMDLDEGEENSSNETDYEDLNDNVLENEHENARDNESEIGGKNAYEDGDDVNGPEILIEEPRQNDDSTTRKRIDNAKKRGRNKCKEIATLKPGEKLQVTFYKNRAVGTNHQVFVRHFGIIVRDTNIVPVRVHKWNDIGDRVKDHMWTAVTDVFTNENMESYRQHVLDHMKTLWTNWRSDLLRYNVTKKKITLQAAYNRKPPNGLDKNEWRWLIKEIYSKPAFKEVSARNSSNRLHYPKELAHRTGSKPFRQVIWKDLGGNEGTEPDLLDVFYATRKKGNSLPNAETTQKYDEIKEIKEKDPSLSNIEVAQKVFKSKSRDRVVGLGGGMKIKDIRGPQPSRQELEAQLNTTKMQNEQLVGHMDALLDENKELKERMGSVEAQMKKFQDLMMNQFNITSSQEHQ